jgi:hypothetical protein
LRQRLKTIDPAFEAVEAEELIFYPAVHGGLK